MWKDMKNTRDKLKKYLEERKILQGYLVEHGLTETEASCLTYLGTKNVVGVNNAISIGEVFEALVPPHSTSRISAAMVKHYREKLITKEINPEEQRSTLVSLTQRGLAEYKKLEALWDESPREGRVR